MCILLVAAYALIARAANTSDVLDSSAVNQDTYSQQYMEPIYVPTPPVKLAASFDPCSCVSYVKWRLGVTDQIWRYPNLLKAYDIIPSPGMAVITTEGDYGHVAYIERVGDSKLLVSEANYGGCGVTHRWIPLDSKIIRGYR